MSRPLVFIALLSLSAMALAQPPMATAVRATGEIDLDGVLADPTWGDAQWQSGFKVASVPDDNAPLPAASAKTRFKIVFDDEAAYVGIECDEPNIADLKAETPWRDGAVWQDDCVEIFFDPGNDGRYYHQVMVNARGTVLDLFGADYGLVTSKLWNGAFEAAGNIDDAASVWSVEVRIPFGAIILGEDAGGIWKWNVTRERHAGGETELHTWSPMRRNFHQPTLFGTLIDMPTDYSDFRLTVDEPAVDVSRAASGQATLSMALSARNETGADRKLVASAALFEDPTRRVESEPLDAPANEAVTFPLPGLAFVGSAPQTNVVFSIRDADSGKLLRAVVKNLSSEYKPITLTVLRPCYRNSIYATEDLEQIEFQVDLAAQVRQAAERVSYRFTSDAGATVSEATLPASETTEPVSVEATDLAVGAYVLSVAALGADGAELAATETTITKLPGAPGNEVRVDENRNVVVNGEPLLAIGWYGGVPTDDPREDVVALQNITTPVVVGPNDTSAIAKSWDEHGIYSVVSVENGRLYYAFDLWRTENEALRPTQDEYERLPEPSDDVKRMAREIVEAAQGEPGLLGYYIADEPEIHNVRSSYLEAYYQYLREIDPYHPVFVTNDTIDGIVTHGYKCADVLDPDPYSPKWDYVPSFLKKVNEVASRGKATYLTPWHSSGQTHFVRDYGSAPPYPFPVLRNQTFVSIAYGAVGFTGYTSAFFMPEIEHRYGLPHIWRELRFLEPAILAPDPAEPLEVTGAPELARWAKQVGDNIYIILVNHKPGEVDATVAWPPLADRQSLYVMSEGREVPLTDGSFSDHFAEGAVHIYTDDPAAKDLPTVDEILVELGLRHARSAKPGNLLHSHRGTRVRSSDGYYAPWFHQYYYYAVNGITDDRGWSMHSWDGESAWVELTLNEPSDIGRVVLHTPNITDYQLDFIAPGAPTSRITVTGNAEAEITHNMQPALPCLKLRLTVTAARDVGVNGGKPMLSEIEAYAEPGEGVVSPIEAIEGAAAADVDVLFGEQADPPRLWEDDFTDFAPAPKYYWDERDGNWVLDAEKYAAKARPGGGLVAVSTSAEGYAGMTRILPYTPEHRFFQVMVEDIEGDGYRYASVNFSNPSGTKGYRGGINSSKPGLYTVDTHAIHENFATGTDKKCFVRIGSAGSSKKPDDTITPGPQFTFGWVRLSGVPENGLVVTHADGAPLGFSIKPGDVLHLELHLAAPAQDAVVEVVTGPSYAPLAINGDPYVQLHASDETARVWVGEVTVGEGTGKFKLGGYPALFKASVVGSDITETFASASVSFE